MTRSLKSRTAPVALMAAFALGGGAMAVTVAATPASAQDAAWPDPDQVVTLVVPFGAGGGTDLIFRALADEMGALMPARIQIANIGGAGSATGTNEAMTLPADGYTLLASGAHTISATMQGLTDGFYEFDHIVGLNWDPFIVAVLADSDIETFSDLVDAAAQSPGAICLGNAGMGGATGIASVSVNLAFDNSFNVTPFDGGANLRADLLGGRCEAGIFSQSEIVESMDSLTPLLVLYSEPSRLAELADVPTLGDLGYDDLQVPGGSYRSISVRSGTDEAVKQAIADLIEQAFFSDGYQAFMEEAGLVPAFTKLDDNQAYQEALAEGFEEITRAAGLYNR